MNEILPNQVGVLSDYELANWILFELRISFRFTKKQFGVIIYTLETEDDANAFLELFLDDDVEIEFNQKQYYEM